MKECGTLHAKLCVCVAGGQVCGSAHPLAPVRNLPFSLLKAGGTMERGEVDFGGGGMLQRRREGGIEIGKGIHADLKIDTSPTLPVISPLVSFDAPVFCV